LEAKYVCRVETERNPTDVKLGTFVCRVHREKPDRETKLKKTNPTDVN
jgi:hypothetical protein